MVAPFHVPLLRRAADQGDGERIYFGFSPAGCAPSRENENKFLQDLCAVANGQGHRSQSAVPHKKTLARVADIDTRRLPALVQEDRAAS